MKMRKFLFSSITVVAFLFLTTSVLRAQETPGVNLTLSPVFLSLTTDPGEAVTTQFKVRNNNNIPEKLVLTVYKFEASADGANPVLINPDKNDEFMTWLKLSPTQFNLAPNQTQTVTAKLDPPKDAALGYYYAVRVNRVKEQGEGAVIAGAPAISLLLNVRSPNAKRELQLVDFSTDSFIYEYLPVNFDIKVKNTGNIHVAPFGDIFLDWGGSQDIAIIPANESRGNILPQTNRSYLASWTDGFVYREPKIVNDQPVRDAKGNIEYKTSWDLTKLHKFRIGKYTAHLLMVYDNGERDVPVEATTSFWVIPWKILIVVGLIVFFAFQGMKDTIMRSMQSMKKIGKK